MSFRDDRSLNAPGFAIVQQYFFNLNADQRRNHYIPENND